MTDLASLILKVDSTQVASGVQSLDGLTRAGTAAEGATERLSAATAAFGAESRSAARLADEMVATTARQVNGYAAGVTGLNSVSNASRLAAYQVQNLTFQLNDVVVGLASGQKPLTVFLQQGAQIGQIVQQAGLGVKGFAVELATLAGILKTSGDAQLAQAAATALANETTIAGLAERAVSALAASEAELALAKASAALAAGTDRETAAQARVAAAHEAVAVSATEARIAQAALATASETSAVASTAAAAATTVALGTAGAALAAIAAVLGVAAGGFIALRATVADTGVLDKYAQSIGLTKAELDKAGGSAVTLGDVFNGLWKSFDQATGASQKIAAIRDAVVGYLQQAAKAAVDAGVVIYAGFSAAYMTIVSDWRLLPNAIGEFAINAANAAIAAINGLLKSAIAGLNSFASAANSAIGQNIVGHLATPQIGLIKQQFAGAGAQAAGAFQSNFTASVARGKAALASVYDNIIKAGEDRLKAALGPRKAAAGAGGRSGSASGTASGIDEDKRALDAAIKSTNDYIAAQQREYDLLGLTAKQQREYADAIAIANAPLAEQKRIILDLAIAREGKIADLESEKLAQADFAKSIAAFSDLTKNVDFSGAITGIDALRDSMRDVADLGNEIGDGLAAAFGKPGEAVANLLTVFTSYGEKLAEIAATEKSEDARRRKSAELQVNSIGNAITVSKSFFKENTTGFRALEAAEKAYRAVQFALSVRAVIQDTVETVRTVLGASARAAAHGAEGIAAQAKLPFPLNLAAMAATGAALLAAGISIIGGGGGGGAAAAPAKASDVQAAIGTGTVLGAKDAQSESLGNALDLLLKNNNKNLEYSNEMVRALRSIEAGISGLTTAIARQLNLSTGGSFDTKSLNIGQTGNGGFLGLFASSTTRTLYDQGIKTFNQTVGDVLAQGFNAQVYNVIEQVKKNSGFLGIGSSTRTTYETTTGAVAADITKQFNLVISNVTDGVLSFAKALGIDVKDSIAGITIPAATLSFKDLSGDQIQKALEAYFSSVADAITTGAFASGGFDLASFQKAGEGLFETLARVTKTISAVSTSLNSIGAQPIGGSVSQRAAATTALSDQFGGLDELQSAVSSFRDTYLSEAERLGPIVSSVRAELDRLGQGSITTKDQFKQLVLSLDLSTDAGQSLFASLLAVAPAFATATDYLDKLNGVVAETTDAAKIAKERRSLEIQLLEATGQAEAATNAKRQDALAGLISVNRALGEQVYAAQDAAAAAKAAIDVQKALDEGQNRLTLRYLDAVDPVSALALRRTQELDATNELQRALLEQVYAAEDAAKAAATLASAQAAVASEQRTLQLRYLDLTDAAGALAARRADEMNATNEANRALLKMINAAEDAKTAQDALATAQQAAADAAQQAASAEQALSDKRASLQVQLLQAQGNAAAATALQRQQELAATDPALRGLQADIYAAQDKAATDALIAEAMAAAAAAAAEAAQKLGQETDDLRLRLLRASGNEGAAVAIERQRELDAALSDANRATLRQIYQLEDATKAQDRYNEAVTKGKEALSAAYDRESGALKETIKQFGDFGKSLRDFRETLAGGATASGNAYRAAQAAFVDTASAARLGDATALGALSGVSKTFLDAARAQSGSALDYQRDVARVAQAVDAAIGATDEAVDYAQAQLDALTNIAGQFIELNQTEKSVLEAVQELQALVPAAVFEPASAGTSGAITTTSPQTQAQLGTLNTQVTDLNSALIALATGNADILRLLKQAIREGAITVRTDDDAPLLTEAAA